MRKSVIDSSALISLGKTGLLSVLKLRGEILAPAAVRRETVVEGRGLPGSGEIRRLFEEGGIKSLGVSEKSRREVSAAHGLRGGDAEVLALAIGERADEIIVNDVKVSRRAERAGFEVTSACDLLYEGLQAGVLDYGRYREALDALVSEGEISPELALFYKSKGGERHEKG